MRKMLKAMITEDGSETAHELAGILRTNGFEVSTVIKDGMQIIEKPQGGRGLDQHGVSPPFSRMRVREKSLNSPSPERRNCR